MSLIELATQLDALSEGGPARLAEGRDVVVVSQLDLQNAKLILRRCAALGLSAEVFDPENTRWDVETLTEPFAPFRVTIRKPELPDGLRFLTLHGLRQSLKEAEFPSRVAVARLENSFATQRTLFMPWSMDEEYVPGPTTKSPRSLVREYGDQRYVPSDIRPWLLASEPILGFDNPVFRVWAMAALQALLLVLPNEIDAETGELKFMGHRRLILSLPAEGGDPLADLTLEGFKQLQSAVSWVFENDRESEMRHLLLAAELAQSGGAETAVISCLKHHIGPALSSAKIAYQMSLSELSKDTLKALGDLRKAVTEETSKVTDATRQTIGALASAIAVGIGLIAAKVTTGVQPGVLIAVMSVAAAYVLIVIVSGAQFLCLQSSLRKDWRPHLYRFLPADEFEKMVSKPIRSASITFGVTSLVGVLAVGGLLITLIQVDRLQAANKGASQDQRQAASLPVRVAPQKEGGVPGSNGKGSLRKMNGTNMPHQQAVVPALDAKETDIGKAANDTHEKK